MPATSSRAKLAKPKRPQSLSTHETERESREKRKFKRQRGENRRPGNDSYSGHASEQVKKKQMGERERAKSLRTQPAAFLAAGK
jgi:hypothetical protein